MPKHKWKPLPRKDYGAYQLDEQGAEVLIRFCTALYREYCDGVPLPSTIEGLSFTDFKSRLYYKFYKDFTEGRVDYQFDVTNAEWLPKPPDLKKLTQHFSKEV
jgi:hypothetical protein